MSINFAMITKALENVQSTQIFRVIFQNKLEAVGDACTCTAPPVYSYMPIIGYRVLLLLRSYYLIYQWDTMRNKNNIYILCTFLNIQSQIVVVQYTYLNFLHTTIGNVLTRVGIYNNLKYKINLS